MEAKDLLSTLWSVEGFARFVILLLPGFIAMSVHDMRVPGERRKYNEVVIPLVSYSILIDALSAGFLLLNPISIDNHAAVASLVVVSPVIAPALVGYLTVSAREWLSSVPGILAPSPKAWDHVFKTLRKKGDAVAIICRLKDGTLVGGWWEKTSNASSFPNEEDLFIGCPCDIDQETGRIISRDKHRLGLLLRRDEIERIEIIHQDGAQAPPTSARTGSEGTWCPRNRASKPDNLAATRGLSRPCRRRTCNTCPYAGAQGLFRTER